MSRIMFIGVGLLTCSFSVFGQLVLQPGDVYTYQFNTLPQTGLVSAFGTDPGGSVSFQVNSGSFQNGDSLRYEMFENSIAEQPICSGTMSSAPPYTNLCKSLSAWQDVQGVFRLTMISGSVTVDSFYLEVIKPGPSLSSYNVYSATIVPVTPTHPLPLLSVARAGSKVVVSWPQGVTNDFSLQSTTNLGGLATWANTTNHIYSVGTNYYTTNDLTPGNRFFRLHAGAAMGAVTGQAALTLGDDPLALLNWMVADRRTWVIGARQL